MTSPTSRVDLRSDAGQGAVSTLLKVVVLLGVPGVIAFDALSCVINLGVAGGLAEDAARQAALAGGQGMSNQQAYNLAEAYVQDNKPAFTVVPESVRVDARGQTVTLAVRGTAPTVVFKLADFSKKWTEIDAEGTVPYRA